MEHIVYNQKGEKTGTITLPKAVFNVPWNGDLVHQAVETMRGNRRTGVAHTKDRGDVRGGGKKPWKQKGTGRARHGSTRSPIWVGGGVAHGPRNEKNFTRALNKKMRAKALGAVLSRKLHDREIIFVDRIVPDEPKTKYAKGVLEALGKVSGFEMLPKKRANAALIALGRADAAVARSFRNMGHVEVVAARDVNPVQALSYKYLVVAEPEVSTAFWHERMTRTKKRSAARSV